jgi:hypothetical protein
MRTGGKFMFKESKEKLPDLNGEKLSDNVLEDVSGGQIELTEDTAEVSA